MKLEPMASFEDAASTLRKSRSKPPELHRQNWWSVVAWYCLSYQAPLLCLNIFTPRKMERVDGIASRHIEIGNLALFS